MHLRRVGRPAGLVQVVRDEIERLIVAGKLQPGDRLPTEKELAEQLGVGRSSVREALRALAEMGIVEIIQGKGTFVRNEPQQAIKAQLQFLINFEDKAYEDLTELRRLLEVGLVRLAAERAGEADLERLRASLAEMSQARTTELLVEAGTRFHLAVAEAAKNAFATALYAAVTQVINEVYRHLERSQAQKERSIMDHQAIYDAIARRDGDLAAQRMEAHLTHLRGDFVARPSEGPPS
ncbi:MAG: GntR family transcriptional regulator, transcriptional repressor for pyruvate dehydrogenase complex [Bacillota bacterium]|nr:GntR family transcriptional regulator, transcriptional repressor for pyruvate dehydrogenase complex [Bacillota bacterium]